MTKIKINIEDLFNLKGSVIYNPDSFKATPYVSTDTRLIKKNSIFVALVGEKFDGHNFANEAVKKGASAIIINRNKLKNFEKFDNTIITVKDTTAAYGELAKMWRNKLNARVIAITGSNGKTTSKEMLSAILSQKYSVCRTLSNNNNHIGVPLTIFSANENHDFLVLELGTNHFGEIAYTSEICEPDYSLITNIGSSHLEFLKDLEGVADEKTALFKKTLERGGKIFLNTDDKILKRRYSKAGNKVTFGFKDTPDIKGEIKEANFNKSVVQITSGKKKFNITLPVSGLANTKNLLASAAVSLEIGMAPWDIANAMTGYSAVDKRMNVIELQDNILINDTYNANPESMRSAFEFLGSLDSGRKKIAVLGDMFELGNKAPRAHKELAAHIKKNKINEVYAIGKMMKLLVKELSDTRILAVHFDQRGKLADFLLKYIISHSAVLVKGSRGMKMEEFFKLLKDKMK